METVTCEFCGKTLPKEEAHYDEDGGFYVCDECWTDEYVDCERCGAHIPFDDAYQGFGGYLCECCHDELFL